MNSRQSWTRWLALITLACACALPFRAQSAVSVIGPTSGAPGDTLSFDIVLTTPLVTAIDELTLSLMFDPGVLTGIDAVAGPLLAPGGFGVNPTTGQATHSFLSTLSDIGPGRIATWTFRIDPAAVPNTTTVMQATLQTFVIDNELTASLISDPLTISVVPEPSVAGFLLAGLVVFGVMRVARRG